MRVGFSKKKFKIWFDPSVEKPEHVKPSLLELTMHNQVAAKRLWVICAEQHTFFRCATYMCLCVCVCGWVWVWVWVWVCGCVGVWVCVRMYTCPWCLCYSSCVYVHTY